MKKFGITCDKNGSEEKGFKKERKIMFKTIKKIFGAFAIIGAVTGGTMAVANAPSFVQTAYAAQRTNSSGGYSIPKEITIKKGESKKINITKSGAISGEYYSVDFGSTRASYVGLGNYYSGTRWNKEGSITVTGKAKGYSTIIAYIKVYKKSGNTFILQKNIEIECRVNVTDTGSAVASVKRPLKSISLNRSTLALTKGQTGTLNVSFNPSNTTDSKSVTWTSSNRSVATVSGGKVTAVKAGTATITANVNGKTAACTVKVSAPAAGTSQTSKTTQTSNEKYWNVSEAYTLTNTFRTTRSNQWYWNSDNKTKTYTYGLKALTRDAKLEETAKKRAKEQWTQYYVNGKTTHNRLDGSKCWTAYPSSVLPTGENLSWGRTSCKDVINVGWGETNKDYSGQGHRRNMLSKDATKVGIACYEKDGKTCWAMCLGR